MNSCGSLLFRLGSHRLAWLDPRHEDRSILVNGRLRGGFGCNWLRV
jgi:hypothetical protein